MLLTNLFIQEENDKIFRLSEKMSRLIFYFIVNMAVGIFLISCGKFDPPSNIIVQYSFYLSGCFFILSGIIWIFKKGYVLVDKKKKEIAVYIGIRKLCLKHIAISFNAVDCIMVQELSGSRSRYVEIRIKCRDERNVLIDKTKNDLYSNEIASKLMEHIGCKFHSIRS